MFAPNTAPLGKSVALDKRPPPPATIDAASNDFLGSLGSLTKSSIAVTAP